MNYEEMSDQKINELVTEVIISGFGETEFYQECAKAMRKEPEDYCNSWKCAGPIIEENNICLETNQHDGWAATHEHMDYYIQSGKLLRAAMMVLLKMQDAKQ